MANSQRIYILNNQELSAIYDLPKFNDVERRHFFALSDFELEKIKLRPFNGRETSSKLYFILQLGYFKAKHLFFRFQYSEIKEDVSFICNTYLINDLVPKVLPTRKFQLNTLQQIMQWMGFQSYSDGESGIIRNTLTDSARRTVSPVDIFVELRHTLEKNKIVLPPYSVVQDIIGATLKKEEDRITQIMQHHLTLEIELLFQNLFVIEDVFYKITELKFDAKSFQTEEMQGELDKLQDCSEIYCFSNKVLPHIDISKKNIEHYADLAKNYTAYRLKRMPKAQAYFYVMCYVHNRYEKIVNNLIKGFIYYVDKYNADSKKYALKNKPDAKKNFYENKSQIGELIRWYTDDNVMKEPGLLIQERAYNLIPKNELIHLSQTLLEINEREIETRLIWDYHKNNYRCILINLRPLFLAIDFEANDKAESLNIAISYLKNMLKQNKKLSDMDMSTIPVSHILPKKLIKHFTESSSRKNKTLNTYQYEFYLYSAIRNRIKNGQVFINNSLEYKSFVNDLKISPQWETHKEQILQQLNNPVLLADIKDTLLYLKNQLEPLIIRVNERALNGENKHIKINHHRDGTRTWTIPYPQKNPESDNPFYNQLEPITISEVYDFIAQRCDFFKAFKHIKPHYAKSKLDYLGIKATILANGTTLGTYQFAKRSNLKYQRLQITEQNHIRLETLREAAAIIVDYLVELPIFNSYNIDNLQHGSIDGKKKKTKRRILQSRHSPKYFGLDIGVVIMTMNLNNLPFVTRIIGANEHESHFNYSMLMENLTAVDPAIISTDTAGTHNVNDLLYFLIGKTHAACYRSTADKAQTISGFKPLTDYDGLLIKPQRRVNERLIQEKWPDLVPILVSLLSHETTQHIIVSKLSSHEYKSDVKDALWELNNILKSIHLLKYIDDPKYRKSIRTALNRGEGYHQLLDKITLAGGGDFRGMSELEVEIWNECTRLIALIIIAYNMCLLSELYELKMQQGNKAALEFLKHISPIASQHINIDGLYEFTEEMQMINLHEAVDRLTKILDETLKAKGK
ncbi:TPA: Tn3 family transposase [Legionella pneumophila]